MKRLSGCRLIFAAVLAVCANGYSYGSTLNVCNLGGTVFPGLADQAAGTADCAFTVGVAATSTPGYFSGNISVAPGLLKASADVGNESSAFGSNAITTQGAPGNSATGISAQGGLTDIGVVENLTVPWIDATFGVILDGQYGALAGDSGHGSLVASFFNAIGYVEDISTGGNLSNSFNVVGCASQFSDHSDFGSTCNGTLDFAGGGDVSSEYLLHLRVANNNFLLIQLNLIANASMDFEGGAAPNAFAGASFGHTLAWGGLVSATDPDGNPYTGPISILAADGFDYAGSAGAPEPSTFALGGLACAFFAVRRRRSRSDCRRRGEGAIPVYGSAAFRRRLRDCFSSREHRGVSGGA